eukprot:SAG22_NODE_243_length_14055_cov_3.073015_2_plen_173_part_00
MAKVRLEVEPAVYAAKAAANEAQLAELVHQANTELPIFAMYPGTCVGAPVALHFFEPRYKILIRRAAEGNRLFVFCAGRPAAGARACVVRIDHAAFLPDGRANVVGVAVEAIELGEVWVEEGTGGLAHTRSSLLNSTPRGGGGGGGRGRAADGGYGDEVAEGRHRRGLCTIM